MRDAARATQCKHVLSQRDDVVAQASRFTRRIHSAHEPGVMCRDTSGAVVGVTALRLDAADCHHGLATDVDRVPPQRKREQRCFRKAQFA